MSDVWTVWMCCEKFETFDSKEEAFETAHAYSYGDNCHMPHAVEGPNGEDLTEEFKAYDFVEFRRSYDAWKVQCEAAKSRLVGSVEVRSPDGAWYGEHVYSEEYRDELLAEKLAAFGDERVRFVPATT